ncbi:hypothetical protein F4703DRAFT_1214543 [Phycomyces blakesleeanus]
MLQTENESLPDPFNSGLATHCITKGILDKQHPAGIMPFNEKLDHLEVINSPLPCPVNLHTEIWEEPHDIEPQGSLTSNSSGSSQSGINDLNTSLAGFSSDTHSQVTSPSNRTTPQTVEQVYKLCERARATGNPRVQLELCNEFIDSFQLKCTNESLESFSSGSSSFAPGDPKKPKIKKKDRTVNEVMLKEALRILERLATTGQGMGKCADSEAQYILANFLGMGGLGLKVNHDRAFQLYIQASKQCHPEATYRAAVCYELGLGTRKDTSRAIIFYRKAAHLCHPGSMYKLGMIMLRGYCNQTPVMREAVCWLQRAAKHATAQVPHALHTLAMIQITGELGESTSMLADTAYAIELLLKAATFGYAPSQVKLGECYETGELVKPDDRLSILWYSRAAQLGSAEGALGLSTWYLTGSETQGLLDQSDLQALLWARKATIVALAMENDSKRWTLAKACYTVGFYMEHGIGLDVPSIEEAIEWYKQSADNGHYDAARRLDHIRAMTHHTDEVDGKQRRQSHCHTM